MKLYSDNLSTDEIFQAARIAGVEVFHIETLPGTRLRKNGWEISLSGSSPFTSQTRFCEPHKAATWCEHGVFMAELYKLDPALRISWYKTLQDFIEQTRAQSEHYGNQNHRNDFRAPWLEDDELLELAAS